MISAIISTMDHEWLSPVPKTLGDFSNSLGTSLAASWYFISALEAASRSFVTLPPTKSFVSFAPADVAAPNPPNDARFAPGEGPEAEVFVEQARLRRQLPGQRGSQMEMSHIFCNKK